MLSYLRSKACLSPNIYPLEEERNRFIYSTISDFCEAVTRHGVHSSKLNGDAEELLTVLYEYVENNIEKFIEEPSYEDYDL